MSINVAAVGDPGDEDEIFGIVHRIDDAVIANADAEVIPTGKLYRARRTRINPEAIDRSCNAIGDGSAEPAIRLDRLRMEADVVLFARFYLRTVDQGMARSASPPACSPARRSSRYPAPPTMARDCPQSMR